MAKDEKGRINIAPLQNGTALDHLPVRSALKIVGILKPSGKTTVAMNVESRKMGHKDLVFLEGRELTAREIEKIALIARGATLNVIRNSKVARKEQIALPKKSEGVMRCINPNCITNKEHIGTRFAIKEKPLGATCFYCETRMNEEEIASLIE